MDERNCRLLPDRRRREHDGVPNDPRHTLTIACHPSLDRIGESVDLVPGIETKLCGVRVISVPHRDGVVLDAGRSTAPLRFIDGANSHDLFVPRAAEEAGVLLCAGDRIAFFLQRESEPDHSSALAPPGMVGRSAPMQRLYRDIARARDRPEPVLILGESGSGKELVARALHAEGPFAALNLAAVPPSIAASELFGHRAGSFTGAASDRPGAFARAAGGTLFLDEVGETPLDIQAMLLRAVEEQAILPVGADRDEPTRLRLITATDADLFQSVRRGGFKKALYYRLAAIELFVPPLRTRGADILRLLVAELRREWPLPRALPWLTPAFVARLLRYPWPGNVRELRNFVRRLSMLDGASPAEISRAIDAALEPPRAPEEERPRSALRSVSTAPIPAVLAAHGYKVHAAATALGISPSTLYRRIREHPELRVAKDIDPVELRRRLDDAKGDVGAIARELRVSAVALRMRMRTVGLI